MLLAGGLGTRLRPLTDIMPKCLVPIKGQPLLEIWLNRLANNGIETFFINTHYLAKQVREFIKSSPFREQVLLSHEVELLGTAGTVIANLEFFQGQDGMLIHADNLCLADLSAFQAAHHSRPPECLITMMTFRTTNPSSCGIVELNERGVVINFHEKVENPPGNLANGAIYILSAEFLSQMSFKFEGAKDFSTEVLNQLVGRIYSFETCEKFLDIGTPENYEIANI